MEHKITHNEEKHRFEANQDGHPASIEYQLLGKEVMNIYQSTVPEPAGTGNLGPAMMKEALDFARRNHYKVLATCPFAQAYLRKHPDYRDILS